MLAEVPIVFDLQQQDIHTNYPTNSTNQLILHQLFNQSMTYLEGFSDTNFAPIYTTSFPL